MKTVKRNRIVYFLLIIVTIAMGLCSRYFSAYLPPLLSTNLGDILWATMVYFGFAFLFNTWSIRTVSLVAISFSVLIEISQLYQASWLNAIRQTTLGGLVLGFGFLWSDLICYAIGVLLGMVFDYLISFIKNSNE